MFVALMRPAWRKGGPPEAPGQPPRGGSCPPARHSSFDEACLREDDKRPRAGASSDAGDLDCHGALKDVEQLIDEVRMQFRRGIRGRGAS